MLGSAGADRDRRHHLHGVAARKNLLHFYRHESCGKCTPCREGSDWLLKLLQQDRGAARGRCATSTCSRASPNNIGGKTLCAFGDAAVDAGADDHQAVPRTSTKRTSARAAARCPADWRAAHGSRVERTRTERWAASSPGTPRTRSSSRSHRASLVRRLAWRCSCRRRSMVCAERKVAAYLQQRARPVPRRAARACSSRSPTWSSCCSRRSCGPRRPTSSLFTWRRSSRRRRRSRPSPWCRSAPHDRLLRPAARADPAARRRRERRGAGGLRHHVDGRLRHRAGRLELATASTRCSAACAPRRR